MTKAPNYSNLNNYSEEDRAKMSKMSPDELNEFLHAHRYAYRPKKYKPRNQDKEVEKRAPNSRLHRKCCHCGNVGEYTPSAISRGRGIYCSYECASYHRHDPAIDCICKVCGRKFKSLISEDYCCIECNNIDAH